MIKKIKFIFIFGILILIGLCTSSQARIITTDPTVYSGETATITISSQEPVANGAIDVTSNGGLTLESVTGGTVNGTLVAFAKAENITNGIATYKFKTPTVSKDTTYKVVFVSKDMENADGGSVASSSATATVTVKTKNTSSGGSTPMPTPTEPKFTSVNETVYATTEVNVRKSWSTSSGILGSLEKGKSVTRIGKGDNGWSKVTFNGSTGYIYSEYLTTTKPVEEKPVETPAKEEKSWNLEYAKNFIKLMNPIVPHITEEIWSEVFNNKETIAYESWPTYDKSKLENDTYEMVVQVNGVLRGKVQVPVSYTEVEMKETAKKIENVKMRIDGKTIVKEIVVPKKLVNIVVK